MFIAMLKTVDDQFAIEKDTFGQAINALQVFMEQTGSRIQEALVLEETEVFGVCKTVVSMRTIR